jgi:hypothetical protein
VPVLAEIILKTAVNVDGFARFLVVCGLRWFFGIVSTFQVK